MLSVVVSPVFALFSPVLCELMSLPQLSVRKLPSCGSEHASIHAQGKPLGFAVFGANQYNLDGQVEGAAQPG
jgi:hypothetical protein